MEHDPESSAESVPEADTIEHAEPDTASAAKEGAPDASPVSILTDAVDEFQCSNCGCSIDVTELDAFTQVECPDCSAVEGVPARLGNFLLLKLLGTGGMGGVYYAKDESLGRFVAIKVMLQSLGDDAAFIETFRREAQAVAKLNHPNIAQIYSFGQEKGQPYIVMELVSGERVDKMMEDEGGIAPALAMRICFEVAQGLSAADEAGIVHGDIKPENILLDKKGRAKVVDFGLATVAHAAAAEGIWGTPYYIAPEKIRRQKVDARADIYSLGATLYHILAGSPPFEGETPVDVVKARLEMPAPDLLESKPDMPAKVASVVARMLATERTERYPTYKSLISDMQKALHELGDAPVKTSRLGGKHIRIKKKRSTLNVPAAAPGVSGDLTESTPATGKRRIVIRKKGGTAPPMSITTSTRTLAGGEEPEAESAEPTPEELEREQRARAKRVRTVLTTVSILLILAIAGGVGGFIAYRKSQKRKHRAEWFARSDARESAQTSYAQITGSASNVLKMVQKTSDYEATIMEAVLAVTGQELVVPEPEPEPEPEDAEADANPADASDANATNQPPAKTDTADDDTDAADANDADAAVATPPEEAVTDAEQAEDEDAEAIEADAPALASESVPDAELPPIASKGKNVILNLRKLRNVNRRMQALVEPTRIANATAQRAKTSAVAKANARELKKAAKKAELYQENATALHDAAKSGYTDVVAEKQEHDAEAEKLRLAELEAQREQEEDARKEQARLALEQQAKTEVEQSKIDQKEMQLLFVEHDFEGIVALLEQKLEGYKTEKGREALGIVRDRFKHVLAMRDEIITNINATPFPWGWGARASARDVVKASVKGISIADSAAVYPWKAVSVVQMLKFIDHYIDARGTRATSKAQIAFGAAIYCDEFGDKGKSKAKTYLNRALGLGFPRAEQERLLESGW
jgi:serine/threonine protein kinase